MFQLDGAPAHQSRHTVAYCALICQVHFPVKVAFKYSRSKPCIIQCVQLCKRWLS